MSRKRNSPERLPAIRPIALTIAGSDSGGGAGIQADLKTFAALGVHGLSAITAITAQNTRAVTAVHAVPLKVIEAQIDALFDDFAIGAVKIGMLGNAAIVRCVARALRRQGAPRVVLDPVMIASSGARLLAADAVSALVDHLMPLTEVLTPNLPEASLLLGREVATSADMRAAAADLLARGPRSVVLKGGHLARGAIADHYLDADTHRVFRHARLKIAGHGTGCTLAAAIAAHLAHGATRVDAVASAIAYLQNALTHAYRPGRGAVSVPDHLAPRPRARSR